MGRPALGRKKVLVSLSPEDVAALDEPILAGLAPDRSAVLRELVQAWAQDDRTRRAVASWRSRQPARAATDAAR